MSFIGTVIDKIRGLFRWRHRHRHRHRRGKQRVVKEVKESQPSSQTS